MAEIEIDRADRERAQRLVEFVKREFLDMKVEARFVFAVEMSRLLKPEIDELKRRATLRAE